jgi:hypothetical protein
MSNESVMKAGLREFAEKQIKHTQLLSELRSVAENMINLIDGAFPAGGTTKYPVWTGNMHDSTGIGIYDNGALVAFMPSKMASRPQASGFGSYTKNIWGTEYLQNLLAEGVSKYSQGVWLVLFSAVPYASAINESGSKWKRGIGYFESIKNELLRQVNQSVGTKYTIPNSLDL